jgi:dipeptidyl aminopeptidase/acylaminoacyl peptidase
VFSEYWTNRYGRGVNHRDIATLIIESTVQASSPAVSPDGSMVAFVVSRPDVSTNITRTNVWLAALDGSVAPHPVADGDKDRGPVWSPDGRSLAYVAKGTTDSEALVRLMPVDTAGDTVTLATMPDGAQHLRFSPDGTWLAYSSRTPHERYDAKDESWQAPRKIERFFARLDDEGWIVDRPMHVYVVRTDGSGEARNLTPGDAEHGDLSWLADSSGVVVSAKRHDTWDLDFATDLYRVGLDGTIVALTGQTGQYQQPSASLDGSLVAFLGYDDASTTPQNVHIGVGAPTGGGHRWLSRSLDRTFECTGGDRPPVWESADTLLAVAEDAGQTHLWRVHLDGRAPERLTQGAITVKGFDHAGGVTVLVASCVDGVADVFVLRDGEMVRLTDFTDRFRAAASPQGWDRLSVPTTDGTERIDAWIMRPAGFDPAQRYPVLLNVHGGPHTQYGETLFDEAQFQAAAGFVVVMCNPRGSSGREERWGQSILGPKHHARPGTGWGSVDVDDVLAVLDHVLAAHDFCDPARVGMLGGSYGGFMATWLAARHGHRFRGICSERAVNNMLSEEWSSDIGSIFRTEVGPNHLDDPAAYDEFSPVRWVRDIHVPMLLIHSENDLRCPINQAEELFMALRLLRRDVTFYRFPGEGHELSRSGSPVHRVQRAEIILDWFSERLATGA